MRYDPSHRLTKYAWLRDAAAERRLSTKINFGRVESDAIVFRPDILQWRENPRQCFSFTTEGGEWFLVTFGPRIFIIPERAVILDVAGLLAAATSDGDFERRLLTCCDRQGFKEVANADWGPQSFHRQQTSWRKYGWELLPQDEEENAFERVNKLLVNEHGEWALPTPCGKWSFPFYTESELEVHETPFTLAALAALKGSVPHDGYYYCLDYEHSCYRFYPHQAVPVAYRDFWAKPVWANGDTVYFVLPDMRQGLITTWAGGLHVFGEGLMRLCEDRFTQLLGTKAAP